MSDFDVIVIGGGPGGYVAALRTARNGLTTALVEKEDLGGVCVNWGCIPTKALLRNAEVVHLLSQGRTYGFKLEGVAIEYEKAQQRSRQVALRQRRRIQELLKSAGVQVIAGTARFLNDTTLEIAPDSQTIQAGYIIIATGARPRAIPGLPFHGQKIISYRQALELTTAPTSVAIIGAGPIGLEFATLWNQYGSRVTVVEMMSRALPLEDEDIGREIAHQFKRFKIALKTDSKVLEASPTASGTNLTIQTPKGRETLEVDKVLVAAGFVPEVEHLSLEAAGVQTDPQGIRTDDFMRTSRPHILAIGDVTGKLGLAHVASAQALIAADWISNKNPSPLKYTDIPRCVFSRPQVACVGLTEQQARDLDLKTQSITSPLAPNGKALAENDNSGFVKIVTEAETGRILGVHMIGLHVTELAGCAATWVTLGLTAEQLSKVVFPHPTVSEALGEGVLGLTGRGAHL